MKKDKDLFLALYIFGDLPYYLYDKMLKNFSLLRVINNRDLKKRIKNFYKKLGFNIEKLNSEHIKNFSGILSFIMDIRLYQQTEEILKNIGINKKEI